MTHLEDISFDALFEVFECTSREAFRAGTYRAECHAILSCVRPFRVNYDRWYLLFVATEIYPLVEINDYPERFAPTRDSARALREVARGIWRERWLLVERSIAGDPFLLASGFCLSDIYIAVVSRWAQQDKWRPAHLPKVERLAAAVAARPAAAPVWSRHRPEATPGRFG